MYNHIRGILTQKSPSRVVVEAGGVGYDITVPLSAGAKLPPPGREATVLTELLVREDSLRLIGFADESQRELFRRLVTLSGVGPSMALQILSCMSPQEFAVVVEKQDADALRKIKGIGEKTAKRMILELKGAKMILPAGEEALPAGAAGEAAAALVALGVPSGEAAERVKKALEKAPDAGVEDLIKAALR